jgi:hypothetical protein
VRDLRCGTRPAQASSAAPKQAAKEAVMTKHNLSIVAVAAVFAVVAPLSVATSAAEMNCRIPFGFAVGGKTLPAGSYSIETRDAIVILKGSRASAIVLANRASSYEDMRAKMVFLKTGDRYDLAEVWTGDGAGHAVTVPKHPEDRLRAANAKPERVVITADVENR